ncbi:hypothetical protein N9V13_03045 [Betaproteobacteria bacterium]|nr:hypothetical protein [Betaproteobacteria bacterium]
MSVLETYLSDIEAKERLTVNERDALLFLFCKDESNDLTIQAKLASSEIAFYRLSESSQQNLFELVVDKDFVQSITAKIEQDINEQLEFRNRSQHIIDKALSEIKKDPYAKHLSDISLDLDVRVINEPAHLDII